jgi:phage portal protein, SPP1 gp6-like
MLTTNEMWQAIIEGNSGISEREFLQSEIRKFLSSKNRKDMLTGRRYYKGEHDVLNKKRTTIIENGKLMELENLPNYKIVDNQIDDLVDQKVNYMLGKPLEIKTEDDRITDIFNRKFQRTLLNVCSD